MKEKVIIIGGAERTGTTLAQTIVSNAFGKSPLLPEAHVLCDVIAAYKRAKVTWNKTMLFFETMDDLKVFFSRTIQNFLKCIHSRYDTDLFVLKDPNFSKFFTEITELIPESLQILCVRDPRDIVASYMKIGERDKENNIRSRYSVRDVDYICGKINQFYKNFFTDGFPSTLPIVKYEEIVVNPDSVLQMLSKTFGLKFKMPNYSEMTWLNEHSRHKKTWITELEGHPPTIKSIGDYKKKLSLSEIYKIERDCEHVMKFFGYKSDNSINKNLMFIRKFFEPFFHEGKR